MNSLIQKAIKAIQEGKTEYAIGLLEGVIEMSDTPKSVHRSEPNFFTGDASITNVPYMTPLTTMDLEAQSKLAVIKKMSQESEH